jgi:hypothetical protein
MEIDPFYVDIPCVHCPNCGERYLRPEDLEVHRERHRPVLTRGLGAAYCPKGCRRWLVPDTADTQAHLALCDGAPPLNGHPMAIDKKWVCQEHNFGTDGPKVWGIHVMEHHAGVDPRPPKEPPPVGPAAVIKSIALLRSEKERVKVEIARLGQDVERVDSAIKILEAMVTK